MRISGPIDTSNATDSGSGGGMGLGRGAAFGGGGLGIVGVIIYVLVQALGGTSTGGAGVPGAGAGAGDGSSISCPAGSEKTDVRCRTVAVQNDVQAVWSDKLDAAGQQYEPAQLHFFTDGVSTGCGEASSSTGPFYCPADRQVYIDVSFFQELKDRFGAPGEFAQAYVVAHEYGHHVQQLLGTEQQVRAYVKQHPGQQNAMSVRTELQADCYAGIWAHDTQSNGSSGSGADISLDPGDVQQALDAASAIGDDTLQKQSGGGVNPDSFTHGTSA